jgi:hypothetical protein
MALGVGLFDLVAGSIPRQIQILSFPALQVEAGHYAVHEMPLDLDVTTIAAIERADRGDVIVGLMGVRGSEDFFVLVQMTTCAEGTVLADLEVEFDFRTAPTPGMYETTSIPKSKGVKFVTHRSTNPEVLSYVHYDGYDVRVFRARPTDAGWQLSAEKYPVHDERNDLALP